MMSKQTKNLQYLNQLFALLKKRDSIMVTAKSSKFNDTELRLIGEVLAAKREGKRLISTQLAVRLEVIRSAISQIVNHLEAAGIVRRVPDDVDRKIAYIEVEDGVLADYEKNLKATAQFVGEIVEEYGAERFEEMYALATEFIDLLTSKKRAVKLKK